MQLSKNHSSLVTNSRLAKVSADQCEAKPQPIIETHAIGLKIKMFNPDGGIAKAGRMGTICVCPYLCPADRMGGDSATVELRDEEIECSGAAGREGKMPSQTGSIEMPSQTDVADEVPVELTWNVPEHQEM